MVLRVREKGNEDVCGTDTPFHELKQVVLNVNSPHYTTRPPTPPYDCCHIAYKNARKQAYFEPLSRYPNKITPKPKQAENEP